MCFDVQIINKPEARKVEHLTEEEKLERQVKDLGLCVSDFVQNPMTISHV